MSSTKVAREVDQPLPLFLPLLLSLSPVYFLVQAKTRLGLDSLHISMIQIVLLVILRFLLSFDPRRAFARRSPPIAAAAPPEVELASTTPSSPTPTLQRRKYHGRPHPPPPPPPPPPPTDARYPPSLLDASVYNFLRVTEPAFTTFLPTPPPSTTPQPETAALSTWTSLYKTPTLEVLQHPTSKTLYAIAARFDDVPVRNLFATLSDVEKRPGWDGMCAGAKKLEEVNIGGRRGAVALLQMKGKAVIRAKDMVVVSMVGRLPPLKSAPPEEQDRLRLFCASTSVEHPDAPVDPAFNRMTLAVSGFVAEEWGNGSQVIQLTDLSGLGSWVPSSIVKLVTQTMIPKSLLKLGKVAATYDTTTSEHPAEGDEWLPPLLGSYDDTPPPPSSLSPSDDTLVDEGTDEEESEGPDDVEERRMSPAVSRDLHSLVDQVRTLTSRLKELESTGKPGWFGGAEPLSLKLVLTGAGGAAGAAVAVAALAAWGRRRQR